MKYSIATLFESFVYCAGGDDYYRMDADVYLQHIKKAGSVPL